MPGVSLVNKSNNENQKKLQLTISMQVSLSNELFGRININFSNKHYTNVMTISI